MALLVDFTGGATTQSGCTAPSNQKFDVGTKPIVGIASKLYIAVSRLDTTKITGSKTSTDVYRMISVPAFTMCLVAWGKTITPETVATTATIALGDGDSTAGYLTAVVPSTTANACWGTLYGGSEAFSLKAGRIYPVADTIDVLVGSAAFTSSTGVFDIYALLLDLT